MLVNLGLLQERIAQLVPDHDAVVWGDRVWSHADVAARSRRVANAVRALGLGCRVERAGLEPWESGQDHVALYLYNGPEWIEAMYGVLKARAAFVNVNYRYKAEELRYVLDERRRARHRLPRRLRAARSPRCATSLPQPPPPHPGGRRLRRAAPARARSTTRRGSPRRATPCPTCPTRADDLYVLYTGGTTGMPKGVLWRHEDVFYNGLGGHLPGFPRLETEEQLRDHVSMGIGGRSLICLPFMHGAGQWSVFNSFHRGGTVVLPDETRRLDAARASGAPSSATAATRS